MVADENRTSVVVDRWPLVRLGLRGVLSGAGVTVVAEAAKATEALLMIRAHGPSLVVVGSPIDGLSPGFVRTAKSEAIAPKILVLVARATSVEVAALFAAGADGLVLASAPADELGTALRRIGSGERVVGAGLGSGIGSPSLDSAVDADEPTAGLTAKEREVLKLLAQGHSNKQIARALFIAEPTVKTHLAHVYTKLGVQSRHGALTRAAELGLLS